MTRKTVKQMLIDLYREEREQERCTIVHELKEQAEEAAKPFSDEITTIEEERTELDNEKRLLYNRIKELNTEKDAVLKRIKLYRFGEAACGDALHDRLMNFDHETKNHIREILEN